MRDADVRAALRQRLELQHGSDSLILDEFSICGRGVRADLCVVNGSLSGFEIKSASDTLKRLPKQQEAYSRVFDRVTIVCDVRHTDDVAKIIPDWWEIIEAWAAGEGDIELTVVRRGRHNPAPESLAIAQLLWRDEALQLLEERQLAGGVRAGTRAALCARLATMLPPVELRRAVRRALKERTEWRTPAEPAVPSRPWWCDLVEAHRAA